MKTKIIEWRQKRAALVKQGRDLIDQAEAAKRELSAEEQQQYDAIFNEINQLGVKIEREERQDALETSLLGSTETQRMEPGSGQGGENGSDPRASATYQRAFNAYLRYGMREMGGQEYRALMAGSDSDGGFLVTPTQFVNDLLKNVDDMVHIRKRARKFQLPAADALGVPTLESDPSDAEWTSEIKTGAEDSAMRFGGRELRPNPLAKRLKISRTLLRKVPGVDGLVRERLAYKFAVSEEKAYMLGNGSRQPLGVFVASSSGVPTSRDVSTGNTTTAITFDGAIEAKYFLKQQYWANAEWMFHRDAVKQLAKIKDLDGQYIWTESVRVGEPDRVLGFPLVMSEFCPNTFTTGMYVGMLADFSYYWIADALNMDLQRLDELYAETNQVGLIGRMESDGQPVLPEAFVRVKLAAS